MSKRPIKHGIKKNYTGRVDFTVEMTNTELKWFKDFFNLLALSINQASMEGSRDNAGLELSKLVGINLDSKKLFTFHQGWCKAAIIDAKGIEFDSSVWDSPANAKPLIEFLDFFFFHQNAIIRNINEMEFIQPRKINGHIKGEDEGGDTWEYIFEKSIAYDAKDGKKIEKSQKRLATNYFDEYVEKARLHALVNKKDSNAVSVIWKI